MIPDSVVKQVEIKYQHLNPLLNERSRRLWAATEASALGYGGILAIHRATRISQNTIRAGLKELKTTSTVLLSPEQIRKSGGGRKRVEEREPSILEALDRLVEPSSRGEPECPLRWTCKSVNQLAKGLYINKLSRSSIYYATLNVAKKLVQPSTDYATKSTTYRRDIKALSNFKP
jgi:Rhodopirellula transposase DDE domain